MIIVVAAVEMFVKMLPESMECLLNIVTETTFVASMPDMMSFNMSGQLILLDISVATLLACPEGSILEHLLTNCFLDIEVFINHLKKPFKLFMVII